MTYQPPQGPYRPQDSYQPPSWPTQQLPSQPSGDDYRQALIVPSTRPPRRPGATAPAAS